MPLAMKDTCETCDTAVPLQAEAYICSYECTFCSSCAQVYRFSCPNCGGELLRRPRRGPPAAVNDADDTIAPAEGPLQPLLGDAFGATLLAYHESGAAPMTVVELIERDDGYMDYGDAARYFAPPDAWGPLDRWASAQARGRVLDIGSGAGRHALVLQDAGLEVVALDISPLASEICRQRGVRETFTGTVTQLAEAGGGPFDSILLMGNNLGLLEGRKRAPQFLEALASLAAPGAVIVGHGTDPYPTENRLHLAYHEWNRRRGRMPGQVRIRVRHRALATPWFDYLFASIAELERLLEGTAWRLEAFEPDGASYTAILRRW